MIPPKAPRAVRAVPPHQVLLSTEQTAAMIGRSRSKFYEVVAADPTFPSPVRLPATSHVQYIRDEVMAWVLALPRVDHPFGAAVAPRNVWGQPGGEARP